MTQPDRDPAFALIDRVEKAVGWHDVAIPDRDAIMDGLYQSGGLGLITWEQVDPETKKLIEAAEALPQTGWDDPADVPDDEDGADFG